jgi:hypothetical protein
VALKRGILRLALTALLLITQQAALSHGFHHVANRGGSPFQQDDRPASHSTLCDFHSACAQILGAVTPAVLPLRLAANVFERVPGRAAPQIPAAPPAFRSRGPPVLL